MNANQPQKSDKDKGFVEKKPQKQKVKPKIHNSVESVMSDVEQRLMHQASMASSPQEKGNYPCNVNFLGLRLVPFVIPSVLDIWFSQTYKYSKRDLQRYQMVSLGIKVGPTPGLIEEQAQNLIDKILGLGYQSQARRDLESNWRDRIRLALLNDAAAAMWFIDSVLNGPNYWSDAKDHFSGFSLTRGSRIFLYIMAQSTAEFRTPANLLSVRFEWLLQNYQELCDYYKSKFPQEYEYASKRKFKVYEYTGVLVALKNERRFPLLASILDVDYLDMQSNHYQIAIAELLVTSPQKAEIQVDDKAVFDENVPVYILQNADIHQNAHALGQVFQFRYTETSMLLPNVHVEDQIYRKFVGSPVAELRELRSLIWLGFSHLPDGQASDPLVGTWNGSPPPRGPVPSGEPNSPMPTVTVPPDYSLPQPAQYALQPRPQLPTTGEPSNVPPTQSPSGQPGVGQRILRLTGDAANAALNAVERAIPLAIEGVVNSYLYGSNPQVVLAQALPRAMYYGYSALYSTLQEAEEQRQSYRRRRRQAFGNPRLQITAG